MEYNNISEIKRKYEILKLKHDSKKKINKKLSNQITHLEQQVQILTRLNTLLTKTSKTSMNLWTRKYKKYENS